jgi:CheY-like chemotaxis protein
VQWLNGCKRKTLPTIGTIRVVANTVVTKNTQGKRDLKNQDRVGRTKPAKIPSKMVLVVDDDMSALSALVRLIRSAGFVVRGFSHPKALLNEQLPAGRICLIADIYLPEMNGVELCQRLAITGRRLPTILITGRNDELTRRLVANSDAITVLYSRLMKSLCSTLSLDAWTRE